jgi:hypothetical protein
MVNANKRPPNSGAQSCLLALPDAYVPGVQQLLKISGRIFSPLRGP